MAAVTFNNKGQQITSNNLISTTELLKFILDKYCQLTNKNFESKFFFGKNFKLQSEKS